MYVSAECVCVCVLPAEAVSKHQIALELEL